MIRILQIGLSYDYGGIESFVINYYKKMDHSHIQFDFINPYNRPLAFEKDIIKLGGIIYKLPDFHKNPLAYKKELSKIIKQYSVVHIHMLSASNLIPLKLAKKNGISKIIVHSHNTKAEGILRTILHYVNYNKIRKMADIYFACSNQAGRWMFGKQVKYTVIKNAIPLQKYCFSEEKRNKIRTELGFKENETVYGSVGRLNIQKNQLFLIEIFAEILKITPNSFLVIVGVGELYNTIIALTKKLHIDKKVMLLGKRMDVDEIYSSLDCVIFPSLFEGLPLTLVEAQANGLKCYVSKEGVPYETKVIDTFEFISLRKTPQEWAKIITSKTHLRDIEAVKVLKESHYDIDFESNRLEKVYSSEIMR